jgi:hypothetical protein
MYIGMMSKQSEILTIRILTALVAIFAIPAIAVFIAPVGVDHQAYALRIQDSSCATRHI